MSLTATVNADHRKIRDENLQWGFTQMPRPVLKAKGLSFRAKCLYAQLRDYARDKDVCFPGQEQLAEDLDTSVDTIQRALQELKDYGLIDIKRQGLNKPNRYVILPLNTCLTLRLVQPTATQETATAPPGHRKSAVSGHRSHAVRKKRIRREALNETKNLRNLHKRKRFAA